MNPADHLPAAAPGFRLAVRAPTPHELHDAMTIGSTFFQRTGRANAIFMLLCGCNSSKSTGVDRDADVPSVVYAAATSTSGQDAAPTCPGKTIDSCSVRIPSFSRDVYPIIISRCEGCHSPSNDAGLWPLDDQESLFDWQVTILQVLRNCTQPPPGSVFDLTERKTLEAWLVCGAPNN